MDQPTSTTTAHPTEPAVDPLLSLVLDGFDHGCCAAGLTVTIGSLIVCGNSATEAEYVDWLASEVRAGQAMVVEQAATKIADYPRIDQGLTALTRMGERLAVAIERSGQRATTNRKRCSGEAATDPSVQAPTPRRYLYLANVAIWTPGGGLAHLAYWRAPLAAVTGWSLGRIDPPVDGPAPEIAPPSSVAGAGQVNGLALITHLARGFIDGFRTERERLQREHPGTDDDERRMAQRDADFVDEFAREWNRKMEQE